MKKIAFAILTTLVIQPVLQASAAVVVYTDDVALQQNKQHQQFFSQSGLSGERSEVVPGAGDRMPLALVAKNLVPSNWKIEASGAYETKTVSWRGGLVWPQILRDIAQREQVYITLDWVKKIASFHVSGENAQIAVVNESTLTEMREKQQTQIAEAQRMQTERVMSAEERARNDRSQLQLLTERNQAAQEASQIFAEKMAELSRQNERDKQTLESMLAQERQKRQALEERYAVIDSSTGKPANLDATDLFAEHQRRSILPFDPSFDYFIKGGYKDVIEADTPATYIARRGTVESVIQKWCNEIGCILEYRAGIQHENPYQIQFKGSFYQAATELVLIFRESDRPLDIQFWPDVSDGKGRKGLVVVTDLNFVTPR